MKRRITTIQKKWDFLIHLLKTAQSYEEIDAYRSLAEELMPAVAVMFDFDQQNHAHQYDLWEHCVRTVLGLPRDMEDDMLYVAALLHDIGKPQSQCDGTRPDDPNKHYYGHLKVSMEIVRDQVLPILYEKGVLIPFEDQRRLIYYVAYHDDRVSLRIRHLKRHLELATFEEFQKLMLLQVADAKAHVMIPVVEQRIDICGQWAGEYGQKTYQELLAGEYD